MCFSPISGPTTNQERKIIFIREFEDGLLVREDKLTNDEIKVGCLAVYMSMSRRSCVHERVAQTKLLIHLPISRQLTLVGNLTRSVQAALMNTELVALIQSTCADDLWEVVGEPRQEAAAAGEEGAADRQEAAAETGAATVQGHGWVSGWGRSTGGSRHAWAE